MITMEANLCENLLIGGYAKGFPYAEFIFEESVPSVVKKIAKNRLCPCVYR